MYSHLKAELPALLYEAGKLLTDAKRVPESVRTKAGDSNFVTTYDIAVQTLLMERLGTLCPNASFFAEEQENGAVTDAPTFLIDPIDGTTNFIRGLGQSCISVGFYVERTPLYAWIYQPYTDELFFAEAGGGAFLTHAGETTRLMRADVPLSEALATLGTDPYRKHLTHDITARAANFLLTNALDIRRTGSAAIDLAYIAAGRFDILFENILSPWDFAAGRLLVCEAGGVIMQPNGEALPMDAPAPVLAGAPTACRTFVEAFGYEKQ